MSATRTIGSPVGAEVVIDGRRYINFGGSSYLGLAGNAAILEAGAAALRVSGSGYQFARCYQIATPSHQDVEAEAARFFGTPAALYMPAGYYFGLIALAVLRDRANVIFFDELAHHCVREPLSGSGLPSHAFKHLDVEDLRAKLRQHLRPDEVPLIVTDGMYSTFGNIAPLADYAEVMTPYGGRLLVDESHSFGVLGRQGRGACEYHDVPAESILSGGSTGKAFGVLGGVIPASEAEVAAMRSTPAARGASVGLPAAAAMCAASLRIVRQQPELLEQLRSNIRYMKRGLRRLGLDVGSDLVPVATFTTGPDRSMQSIQQRLMSDGIHVLHSNYIGAGAGGVIRCGIFADHTHEHMDRLHDALRRLL
jgi:7-keto-8-aminopelargonate synthetase-like enzyme